jgi:hypothetical protein
MRLNFNQVLRVAAELQRRPRKAFTVLAAEIGATLDLPLTAANVKSVAASLVAPQVAESPLTARLVGQMEAEQAARCKAQRELSDAIRELAARVSRLDGRPAEATQGPQTMADWNRSPRGGWQTGRRGLS